MLVILGNSHMLEVSKTIYNCTNRYYIHTVHTPPPVSFVNYAHKHKKNTIISIAININIYSINLIIRVCCLPDSSLLLSIRILKYFINLNYNTHQYKIVHSPV